MEQVKMSDVFAMPISGNGYYGGFFDSNGELILFSDLEVNQKVSIFKAINDYDQHVELIAKQAEQIKMLREALELVRPEIYYNQDGVEVWAGGNMYIGTDDDADNKTMQKIHEVLSAMEQE